MALLTIQDSMGVAEVDDKLEVVLRYSRDVDVVTDNPGTALQQGR